MSHYTTHISLPFFFFFLSLKIVFFLLCFRLKKACDIVHKLYRLNFCFVEHDTLGCIFCIEKTERKKSMKKILELWVIKWHIFGLTTRLPSNINAVTFHLCSCRTDAELPMTSLDCWGLYLSVQRTSTLCRQPGHGSWWTDSSCIGSVTTGQHVVCCCLRFVRLSLFLYFAWEWVKLSENCSKSNLSAEILPLFVLGLLYVLSHICSCNSRFLFLWTEEAEGCLESSFFSASENEWQYNMEKFASIKVKKKKLTITKHYKKGISHILTDLQ